MAASTVRQLHPDVHIVDPPGRRKFSGVEIVDDPTIDESGIQTIETPDGGVTITVGPAEGEAPPDTGPGNFDDNLAKKIDDGALQAIAAFLLEGIEADLQSRKDWEDTANRAADYLGVKLNDPVTTVSADGTVCQSIATCLLEANLRLWGTARGELLPVGGPVKVKREEGQQISDGPAPNAPQGGINATAQPQAQGQPQAPSRDDLAAALEADMNYFLTVIDREYYPDFSKMLMSRALIGNQFRKVYRDPLKRRPCSVWVKAQDMIISNDCSHISGAGRITERIKMRQSTMRRMQVNGAYLDVSLAMPTGQATETEIAVGELEGIAPTPQLPTDYEHEVYECYCELGSTARSSYIGDLAVLDKDEAGKRPGYPLPYRVSIEKDSRAILEIRRDWKKGDGDHRRRQRYVKYGFIPGLGFWDLGLIHILGNPTQSATMIQRALVDAGLFANFPGGVFGRTPGSRQDTTVFRPSPGQFLPVDMGGAAKVGDMFMPLPYKEPSAQGMAMVQKLEGDARRLGGTIDLPIGEGRTSNVPVGTIMAYIETITMVPGAVHKDDHIAQQQEFELLRELFAEDPDTLVAGNRSPKRRQWLVAELMDPELVPAADPNTPSEVHRLMKKQAAVALGGMPQFQGIANNREIFADVMKYLMGGDPTRYIIPPQPQAAAPPPPQVIAAQIRAQSQQGSDAAKVQVAHETTQAKQAQSASDAIEGELDRQSEEARAALKLKGDVLKTVGGAATADADRQVDHAHHKDTMAQADRQHQADQTNADLDRAQQSQQAKPNSFSGSSF